MLTIPHVVADHNLVREGLYRYQRESDNSAVGGVDCATNSSLSSMTNQLGRGIRYVAEPTRRQCFHDLPNSFVSAVSRIGDRYRKLLGHRVRRQLPHRTIARRGGVGGRGSVVASLHGYGGIAAHTTTSGESMITILHVAADHNLVREGLYRYHCEVDDCTVGGVDCATNNSLSGMTNQLGRGIRYVAEPTRRQCFHDLPNSFVSAVSRIGDRYRKLLGHRVRRQLPHRTIARRGGVGGRGSVVASLHGYGGIAAHTTTSGESMITILHVAADHNLVREGLYRYQRESDNSAVGGVDCATNSSLSSMTNQLGRGIRYVAEPTRRQCFHDLPNSFVSAVSRIGDRYRKLLGHRVRRQLPHRTGLLRDHRTQAQQSHNPGGDQQQRKRFSDQALFSF